MYKPNAMLYIIFLIYAFMCPFMRNIDGYGCDNSVMDVTIDLNMKNSALKTEKCFKILRNRMVI